MFFLLRNSSKLNQKLQIPQTLCFSSGNSTIPSSETTIQIDRITKLINDHPFPDHPLHPTLLHNIPSSLLSTPLVESVLGRLFVGHSNGLKAFEFFKFSLNHSQFYKPTSDAFEKTLHILTRMRNFDKAWNLMKEIQRTHPKLLTLKCMSIAISKFAKLRTFEDTLQAFERMEKEVFVDRVFGVAEFNVLLRAFCTLRQMKEAKAVFRNMFSRFTPNTQTFNILLLGFKESGNITSVELFYHEMIRRGFKPNVVTYSIRIDAYCKKGCLDDALRLVEEMEKLNCLPNVEIMTTLIHGAGIVRNKFRARQLFDEITLRNLRPDIGAYNALMASFVKGGDVKSASELMDEMEEKGIGHDNVTYHTIFLGLKRSEGIEGVVKLCHKIVEKSFIPKSCTVVMLMKFFCESSRPDLGLDLWKYLVDRGCCPHEHAVSLLITGLCSRGQVDDAYECSRQVLERGRHLSEGGFSVLERCLVRAGNKSKLRILKKMVKRLQTVLPSSKGHVIGISSSANVI
ncbi:Pentatricopeptide repeat-containing protein [Thalictrum thalictroides]|uniref:Pentatricopeptide repeat-containing protein n=1 Tax=Thalictrum thalictroides TaxID=46969 RepID=A0A7J6VGB4_THATH|nr:Pentatricopeptide repeat-containing protein [Thalictrum thalictroides]